MTTNLRNSPQRPQLTQQQIVILEFMRNGYKQEEIAKKLGLCIRALEYRIKAIKKRLQATKPFQLGFKYAEWKAIPVVVRNYITPPMALPQPYSMENTKGYNFLPGQTSFLEDASEKSEKQSDQDNQQPPITIQSLSSQEKG